MNIKHTFGKKSYYRILRNDVKTCRKQVLQQQTQRLKYDFD